MRMPDIEGVATRDGPESCAGTCEGAGEALTGVRAGRAIEPRNQRSGVPTLCNLRKAIPPVALSRAAGGPRAVGEPGHVRNLHVREPGEPIVLPVRVVCGRAAQGTLRR